MQSFTPTHDWISYAVGAYNAGDKINVAGRIKAIRKMGKIQFIDLMDFTGKVQICIHLNEINDLAKAVLPLIDRSDIIGATGTWFETKTGEKTVRVEDFTIVSKALRDAWSN